MINMMGQPLRYRICRWPQAAKCLSNNSRNLYISVTDFVQNDTLTGLLIKVEHTEFGTLFAAMAKGDGQIVTKFDDEGNFIPWMSTPAILQQLRKFGFFIYYNEVSSLDDDILNYLMQVRDLGYDKINQVVVRTRENGSFRNIRHTIALKTKENDDILVFGMTIGGVKYNNRLSAGKIISLDDAKVEWDWIDSAYNIEDILKENADIEKFESSEPIETPIMIETPTIEIPEGFTLYDEVEGEEE